MGKMMLQGGIDLSFGSKLDRADIGHDTLFFVTRRAAAQWRDDCAPWAGFLELVPMKKRDHQAELGEAYYARSRGVEKIRLARRAGKIGLVLKRKAIVRGSSASPRSL